MTNSCEASEYLGRRTLGQVSILLPLRWENDDGFNLGKAYEVFTHQNHTCRAFEMFEQNLYNYWKRQKFSSRSLKSIWLLVQQVLVPVTKLYKIV